MVCAHMNSVQLAGTVIVLPPEGFQSCGWMVAKGSGPEEAERNLVKLMKGVVFDLCAA